MSGVGGDGGLKLILKEPGGGDSDLSLNVLPSYISVELVMQFSVMIL